MTKYHFGDISPHIFEYFYVIFKYKHARDIPTSRLGQASPLYRRVMTFGELSEIVRLISPRVEVAPATDFLAWALNLNSLSKILLIIYTGD